jgi:hypothetical protein
LSESSPKVPADALEALLGALLLVGGPETDYCSGSHDVWHFASLFTARIAGHLKNKSEKSSTGLDPHNHWLNSAETAKVNCNLPISHTISAGDP